MVAVMGKFESMDQRVTKMDQSIYAIRVGCDNCGGPHLTKECDLDENGNQKVQACCSSGDRYDKYWRKPKKKWLPYDEYKKVKEEKYIQQGCGFYQKEKTLPKKKNDFEAMLARFAVALEKRR